METELLNIEKVSPEEKAAALKKAGEIIREGGCLSDRDSLWLRSRCIECGSVCEDLCGEGETVR